MFKHFLLTGLFNLGDDVELHTIQLHETLQADLSANWHEQYVEFMSDIEEVEFDPAYAPEDGEKFVLKDFELPGGLNGEDSETALSLPVLRRSEVGITAFHALVAFARVDKIGDVILFQRFVRSRLIEPGRYLFLSDTQRPVKAPILVLDTKLAAVYFKRTKKLLFSNFRNTNAFLPLQDYYQEASEEDILKVLSHKKLAPEDAEATAQLANQWARKRFALLRDSKILENHTVKKIVDRSMALGIKIETKGPKGAEQIVFPSDKRGTKLLLQCLVEQIFRGHITDRLLETNSTREAKP